MKHGSQTYGRQNLKDNAPDDKGDVAPMETEDVSVTKDGKEEGEDGDGGDHVEEVVDPGEAGGEGYLGWRVLLSCKDKVGEGRGDDDLWVVDKEVGETLP